jgi:hypothetical protein
MRGGDTGGTKKSQGSPESGAERKKQWPVRDNLLGATGKGAEEDKLTLSQLIVKQGIEVKSTLGRPGTFNPSSQEIEGGRLTVLG